MRPISVPERSLGQLARSIVAVADAFETDTYDTSKPYKPTCQARRDGYAQHHYTGAWSRQPVDNLHMHAVGYLRRAEDHLRTIALAATAPKILYSPISLARIVTVSSGHCFYLLDPGIEVRERMRRALNLHAHMLAEQRNLIGDPTSPAAQLLQTQITQLCADARRMGFTVAGAAQPWSPHYFDKKIPSDTDIVGWVLDADGSGGGHGKFAFRLFSAAVHSQPNIEALLHKHVISPSREGMSTAMPGLTLETLAAVVAAAACAFYEAHLRMRTYFGITDPTIESAALTALQEMSMLATPPTPTRTR
ncbi:hypothetical protein ACFXHA_43225 [Nocardia sp. NPDC059240]|uniref:hypothetical protein n=1 Tax=Nocardia sp. NPDC059240 TaxID=3346786 RepID=UPI0036920ABD